MMGEEQKVPHVHTAMCEVKKKLAIHGGIVKDRSAPQQAGGYAFRGIDDVYNVLCGLTADHGLAMYPNVVDKQIDYQTNAKGNVQTHYHLTMQVHFVSAIDGSAHHVTTLGEAIDTGDKACGKAQSYAMKMACLMAFQIPTHGEMDTEATVVEPAFEQRAAPPPPQSAPAVSPEPTTKTRKKKEKAEPADPFPEQGTAQGESSGDAEGHEALMGRIGEVNTFPLLFSIAQDADKFNEPARTELFRAVKDRATAIFATSEDMDNVKKGFDLVKALGAPDDLKRAANAAYARFRGATQ